MEKYFPKISNNSHCLEMCMLNPDKTIKIGSVSCQKCINYLSGSVKYGWLECKEIDKATAK